ncbi:MAG: Fic family protein [Coriobacteriales bacterium]|jgi:Fic family protein|nr:Fic family protein [Coriobacteriales bacterium]
MILNHKAALELVTRESADFRHLSLDGILRVHKQLVSGLGISEGIREQPVGITGTNYLPPESKEELQEYLSATLRIVNGKSHPVEAALIISAMIASLQPFSDGNKRTARLIANAVLMAHDYAALSYRSVDELAYKKSVLLVDEQHSLYWYKRLFLEQFEFAVKTYFV